MIHIAQVVLNLDVGGLEKVVVNLVNNLDPARFRTSVYCLRDGGALINEIERPEIQIHTLNKREGLQYSLPFRLAKFFRRERVDIVHTHNLVPLFYGGVGGRLARVPGIIQTIHGAKSASRRQLYLFKRLGIMDKLVAVSGDIMDIIRQTKQIHQDDALLIQNGIDFELFGSARRTKPVSDDLHIRKEGEVVVGTVARLSPEKDLHTLLKGFSLAAKEKGNLRLVIAGDGVLRNELMRRSSELGVSNIVRFLGCRSDIPYVLSLLDMFVLTSATEGLSITLLEAIASFLPVIVTDVGGNKELVVHERTGLLIPPGDPAELSQAILWMASNAEIAETMVKSSWEAAVKKFHVKKMVSDYEKLYSSFRTRGYS